MNRLLSIFILSLLPAATGAAAMAPPLLDEQAARQIADTASGSTAKRTVEGLSKNHRMRGSTGYAAAARQIVDQARSYGLAEVSTIVLPADGTQFYGTQRARPAWNASFAELWEQRQQDGRWTDADRVVSWADQPLGLAQDSATGSAAADLVDVGAGTSQADYAGKDVRGKLVLTSSQPEAIARLAVTQKGAAGIISWAQNQKTAWWGEDQDLLRWGHLDTWRDPTFAFMVTPARARSWQARLATGETVRLRAKVEAGRSPGAYLIPTAVIPGKNRSQEIVYSCHLDHPNPGANDNASGCAGILEVARTLQTLVAEKKLPQPERTIRFIWPCEVECTISLLNGRPEFATRTLATIHLDMIGGDTEVTKSVLQVEGSPPSLSSFVDDVAFSIGRWANDATKEYADTGAGDWALVDPQGSKRSLQADIGGFSEGSDHQVWAEGSWRIPVIYLADWPDRYIHTQKDVPANLDPTKMKRAIFIAAASGWYLANLNADQLPKLEEVMASERLIRDAELMRVRPDKGLSQINRRGDRIAAMEAGSLGRFGLKSSEPSFYEAVMLAGGPSSAVYARNPDPKGPMTGFGYSWLDERLEQASLPRPALLDRAAPRDGASFAYEALNLVNGSRTVGMIRDELEWTVGPVPEAEIAGFLATLEKVGLLSRKDK
ncbi:MAG TPA: M28 family peptidase [Sphingomicrobium sp.]|nr:M28 family peptidase [Sphingomicrobium sp.]